MAKQRHIKQLFKKTEPITQDEIDDVYMGMDNILSETSETPVPIPGLEEYVKPAPAADPKPKKPLKPQSVYLNESELKYIQDIADAYGESRHAVLQYAVKELIRQWKRGKKPRTNNLGKLDK